MRTDNMPSGTATGLGDVITVRGGATVESNDTDAEGSVLMADALVLAGEHSHDPVVDIATLTGSVLRALGTDMAAVVGNDEGMCGQAPNDSARTWHPEGCTGWDTRLLLQLALDLAPPSNSNRPASSLSTGPERALDTKP